MVEKIKYHYTLKARVFFDPINITKKHDAQSTWKKMAIAEFDCDLREYYSWFIYKRYNINLKKPLRKPHLTIINDRITNYDAYQYGKKIYNNKEIEIQYNTNLITQGNHWWLKCISNDALLIRKETGLIPEPYFNFHLTIGRVDGRVHEIEHAKYIHRIMEKYEDD